MAAPFAAAQNGAMRGVGRRLKERARSLGWSDAEVARRLGLAQTRYADYAADKHEPDLAMLVRICRLLGIRPDAVLDFVPDVPSSPDEEKRRAVGALAQALSGGDLDTLLRVAEGRAASRTGLGINP